MRCLFIGGPAAGQVLTVKSGIKFVEFPIAEPKGFGAYQYRVRHLSDGFNEPHTICVSDGVNPLVELMKFYELHAKGESQ